MKQNNPLLSIIIPTYNEENYLPFLLSSIKNQGFKNYEIIVADNNSKDKTAEIARTYGCKIVKGGMPPKARNNGAKKAKGRLLLFLDADVILPENFLERAIKIFFQKKLGAATFFLYPIKKSFLYNVLFFLFYNFPLMLIYKLFPTGGGAAILVKKEIHQKIKGFDEEIKYAEDVDYLRRAAKVGRFGLIGLKVFISVRRFEKEGWVKTYLKVVYAYLYMFFFGPVKRPLFEYKFGNFSSPQERNSNK